MSSLPRPCAAMASSCVQFPGTLPTTATRTGKSFNPGSSLIQGVRSLLSSLHIQRMRRIFNFYLPFQLSQGEVLCLSFPAVLWQVTLCVSVLQCEALCSLLLTLTRLPHAMLHCRSRCPNFVFHKMRSRACWREKSRTAERHWEILLLVLGELWKFAGLFTS